MLEASPELILRLFVSVALGALVGLERELTHKPAGLRTHMLVSLGATVFTITAILNFGSTDVARVIANILVGIGFVGAGSIIATRGQVHGITTAASLWTVAGIGMAVGMGNYILSLVSAVLVFAILQAWKLEKPLKRK